MLNSFFITVRSGSPPDPNIYYRTNNRDQATNLTPIFVKDRFLYVKQEIYDVAVLHNIFLALAAN